MVAGWEIIKSLTPRTEHDLYYWENISNGTTSEVDYLLTCNMEIVPLEVKSGTSGKMKSLRLFMNRKHLLRGKRSSLENFGVIEVNDSNDSNDSNDLKSQKETKRIEIHPLYALSTIQKM